MVIFLFNKNKIFIKSTKTNDAGQYSFNTLNPGSYYCLLPEFPELGFVTYIAQIKIEIVRLQTNLEKGQLD
ncbi:MAG: hypothetical protein IPO26_21035 [Saprospiraceae bacterium]|nr:hypothetical protein [Saprospiraceae bacterium]